MVLLACVVSVVVAGFRAPLSLDESYNAQVPLHLAADGHYATDGALFGGRETQFDPYITTGPTVLLPAGALVSVLGNHLWVMRLVPTAAFLVLLGFVARIGTRLGGRWGGLAATATVVSTNLAATRPGSPVFGQGDLLGEVTCAVFLLWSATQVRRPVVSGLLFGLALLTKVLALMFLPALLLAVLLAAPPRSVARWTSVPRTILGGGLVVGCWIVTRLLVLGPSLFVRRNSQFLDVLMSRGSGLDGGPGQGLAQRVIHLPNMVEMPLPLIVLPALVLGLPWALGVARRSAPRWRNVHLDPLQAAVLATVAGSATLVAWWLFVSDWAFERHLLPALYVGLPVLVAGCVRLVRRQSDPVLRRRMTGYTAVALAIACLLGGAQAWSPLSPSLRDQQAVARVVEKSGAPHMATYGWAQEPAIAWLSGVPARSSKAPHGLLVLSRTGWAWSTQPLLRRLEASCGQTLWRSPTYLVCRTRR